MSEQRSPYPSVWVLNCPCGEVLRGYTEDEIVDISLAHLREKHPDMAEHYEREHVLFMAVKYADTSRRRD